MIAPDFVRLCQLDFGANLADGTIHAMRAALNVNGSAMIWGGCGF